MSKKKIIIGAVTIALTLIIAGIGTVMWLRAKNLSKLPTPKDNFDKYILSWEKNEYSDMYKYLSESTKNSLPQKDFEDINKNIYEAISANNLKVVPQYPVNVDYSKINEIHVPFSASVDTVAGEVKYSYEAVLTKEDLFKTKSTYTKFKDFVMGKNYDWFVTWNIKMVFPQLDDGDKMTIDYPKELKAKRGDIKDRNGKVLATNGTVFQIGVEKGRFKEDKSVEAQLGQILGISADQIAKALNSSWAKPQTFIPLVTVLKEETDKLNQSLAIQGVLKSEKSMRIYPGKEATAHLIGYMGAITQEEIEKYKDQNYSKEDLIGKTGLEYVFEKRLRGKNGLAINVVDANGTKKATLAQKAQEDGENIQLTIDTDLQRTIYEQFKTDAGSAAALNPKTGEVLALVSTPAYDPNAILAGMSQSDWNALNNDPKQPMNNKFSKVYAPGSTFKAVTAAIGLKTGKLVPDKLENITGKAWQPSTYWGKYFVTRVTDPGRAENLMDAFVYSDNIYFAKAALNVGKDDFLKEAKNFGIGEAMNFPFPMQQSQIANDGKISNDIQLADSGYGQGQVLMNPLHEALIYSVFVNKGNLVNPVLEMKDKSDTPKLWHEKIISEDSANIVLNGLTQVIANPSGTGHAAQIPNISLAGKTGTAELKQSQTDTTGKEIGWFSIMNTDNPRLVLTMMVDDVKDRGGSHYIVPKAQEIFKRYLR